MQPACPPSIQLDLLTAAAACTQVAASCICNNPRHDVDSELRFLLPLVDIWL